MKEIIVAFIGALATIITAYFSRKPPIKKAQDSASSISIGRVVVILLIGFLITFLILALFYLKNEIDNIKNTHTFWLPANKLWLNTGLLVNENDLIEITVTGSAHLGVHHLTWMSIADINPEGSWNFYPSLHGEIEGPKGERAYRKSKCAICPDEFLGTLLIHVEENINNGPSFNNPILSKNKLENLIRITPEKNASVPSKKMRIKMIGEIYLVINDDIPTDSIYLSQIELESRFKILQQIDQSFKNNEQFYPKNLDGVRFLGQYFGLFACNIPKTIDEMKIFINERWKKLDPPYRNRLWFDDNIGGYLVTIRVVSGK